MSRELILLSGVSGARLEITADALALKEQALEAARGIKLVVDSESQEIASKALSTIKGLLKQLEGSRTEIKRPVLDIGKKIDGIAATYAKELADEATRLHGAIQTHYRAELEKAEMERQMIAKLEAKRRAAAEEEARVVAEAARKAEQAALNAKSESEAKRLDAEAAEAARLSEEARAKAVAPALTSVQAPEKAEKMTVRMVWKHRVTDIHALLKARPELVHLEPKTAAINAEIRGGLHALPGLEIWEEPDVTVRS